MRRRAEQKAKGSTCIQIAFRQISMEHTKCVYFHVAERYFHKCTTNMMGCATAQCVFLSKILQIVCAMCTICTAYPIFFSFVCLNFWKNFDNLIYSSVECIVDEKKGYKTNRVLNNDCKFSSSSS